MRQKLQPTHILDVLKRLREQGIAGASSSEIHARVGGSPATVGRLLNRLVREQAIVRTGRARGTRYSLPGVAAELASVARLDTQITATVSPGWSQSARDLLALLNRPLGARQPVTYQRAFVDDYAPNETFLLSRTLAEALAAEGAMQGQQPAGTYARKVLEPLLIDLSWSSSRLEGNTYTRLATEELFKSGAAPTDLDGVMLLNHKRAVEFLVDAAPTEGLTEAVIRNLHALLMQDLLSAPVGLGAIRTKVVNISGTTYIPWQAPQQLEEMLGLVIAKARLIKNPAEAAFFLWVNLAYLQPFEDGNKRVSRLAANIPLMLYNCAPLAFLDVDPGDYTNAMLGIYELLNPTLAVELFAWTYRRSIGKYRVLLEAMGSPDPFRVRHRDAISAAVQCVVRERQSIGQAMDALNLSEAEKARFLVMLQAELAALTPYNCARYRVTLREAQGWIDAGRPG